MIEGSVIADTLHSVVSSTSKTTNLNNVGLRQDETTNAYTGIGGAATVTNVALALLMDAVSVAGSTGILTHGHGISITLALVQPIHNQIQTQIVPVTTTTPKNTPPHTPPTKNTTPH